MPADRQEAKSKGPRTVFPRKLRWVGRKHGAPGERQHRADLCPLRVTTFLHNRTEHSPVHACTPESWPGDAVANKLGEHAWGHPGPAPPPCALTSGNREQSALLPLLGGMPGCAMLPSAAASLLHGLCEHVVLRGVGDPGVHDLGSSEAAWRHGPAGLKGVPTSPQPRQRLLPQDRTPLARHSAGSQGARGQSTCPHTRSARD
jgi:hypothetical protein